MEKRFLANTGGSALARGARAPLPDSKAIADRSDVIYEVQKCSKIQISGAPPRTRWQLTVLPRTRS